MSAKAVLAGRVRCYVNHSALRFLVADSLSWFLTDAGVTIEQQFGD